MSSNPHRGGYVAIVGRPNVGKSTLLNHLLGTKLSITSRKPQTTRQRLLGIYSADNVQMMFVDTPGVRRPTGKSNNAINHYMYQQALHGVVGVDLCLHLVHAAGWTSEDDLVVERMLKPWNLPSICALNKIDLVHPKEQLLPVMQTISEKYNYEEIIPIAALKNRGLDHLVTWLTRHLPEQPKLFSDDELTDRPLRFLVGEWIREQLVRQLGDELPYRTTVVVEDYQDDEKLTTIDAIVYVERESQKSIVIGKSGNRIKMIGQSARKTIERFIGRQVYLNLRVRTKTGWTNVATDLASLGYQ